MLIKALKDYKRMLVFLFGCLIGLVSFFSFENFIYILIVILTIGIGKFIIFREEKEAPRVILRIFFFAFVLRLSLCIFLAYIAYLRNGHPFFLGADDFGFSSNASEIVRVWKESGVIPQPNSLAWMWYFGDLNYPYWLSFLYYFIGEYLFMPLFINCSFGALTVIFVYLAVKDVFGYKVAVSSALFLSFWPSLLLWSTQNLKEAVTVFMICFIFWCVIRLQSVGSKIVLGLNAVIALFLLYKVRFVVAFFLFVAIIISLLFFHSKKRFVLGLFVLCVFCFALTYNRFNLSNAINAKLGVITSSKNVSILENMNYFRQVRMVAADTAISTEVAIDTASGLFSLLPSILISIFFSPLPWQVFKLNQIFASVEIFVWLFLAFFAVKGIFLSLRYKIKESSIFLVSLCIITFFMFCEGNIGTIFRHRSLIWPQLLIFTSVGLFYCKEQTLQ